jgi:putative peptidoglycan lipid II flippase
VGYVAANQLSFVATLLVANQLTSGSIAAFDTAYLLFMVPHGLLAVSFMTAVTPELAREVLRGDRRGLRLEWTRGLRLIALVMLPASAGLFVLATPVVQVLVRRSQDVTLTAGVLRAFAVGLAGFSIYLFALRPFYAEGNLRVPFRLNLVQNAFQVVLTISLGLTLSTAPSLALAHSLAYLAAAVLAFSVSARHLGRVPVSSVKPLVTMVFAALAMGTIMAAVLRLIDVAGLDLPALFELLVGGIVGIPTYIAFVYAFGAGAELDGIVHRLRAVVRR